MNRLEPRQAAQWLMERDSFLVLTHIRPDGDTLGSAAALCAILRKLGKRAAMLPNPGTTGTYADYVADYWAGAEERFDHVVAVDIATHGLFFPEEEPYKGKVELCIDHHPSNEFYAENVCLDAERASCGEIILEISRFLCALDDEIATLLYIAVSTDTGCFVYGNTTAATHQAAAELLQYSTRYREVNKRCFRTKSFKRLRLEAMLVENMELFQEGTIAVVSVSCQMMRELNATEQDAEDLAAFAGQVEGVKVSATLRELEEGKTTKISLRTDPNVLNATKTCALLGGGGHVAASGATVQLPLPQAKEAILNAIAAIQQEG
ncbi:MAG: DHH family phosphoesterase [Oscillospiraceae bacterium]|nr:DHH family phosphoesterase [Oscillospiraceae bacterium]